MGDFRFADDSKLFNYVSNAQDIACLINDLHNYVTSLRTS